MTIPARRGSLFPLSAALLALALAGCATTDGGGGWKSLNPSIPSGPGVSGAIAGGLIGGAVSGLDDADRRQAYDAEVAALETGGPGYPVGWRGENARGTVVAGPPYQRAGFQSCRDYSHTIYLGTKPIIARGAACRTPEGRWQAVT